MLDLMLIHIYDAYTVGMMHHKKLELIGVSLFILVTLISPLAIHAC